MPKEIVRRVEENTDRVFTYEAWPFENRIRLEPASRLGLGRVVINYEDFRYHFLSVSAV